MTKRLAVLESDNIEIIDAIKDYFSGKEVEVCVTKEVLDGFDLAVLTGFETNLKNVVPCNVLNIHPSLLPSFKGENAIQETFLAGVKVSGVTVHCVGADNFYGRILAQYPVLIGNTTHIDEFNLEILAVAKKLYPVVIDSVLNDKVFDFSDLFKNSCSGNCGGCGNCH